MASRLSDLLLLLIGIAIGILSFFILICFIILLIEKSYDEQENDGYEQNFLDQTIDKTPTEKVAEWEQFNLCAPGDAISSASWRCKKFENCHDYAESQSQISSKKDNYPILLFLFTTTFDKIIKITEKPNIIIIFEIIGSTAFEVTSSNVVILSLLLM